MVIFENSKQNEAPSGCDVANDHKNTNTHIEPCEETIINLSVSNDCNNENSQTANSNSQTDHRSNYFHNGPSSSSDSSKHSNINIRLSIVTRSSSPKPFKYTLKLIPLSQTSNSTYIEGIYEVIDNDNKSFNQMSNVKQMSSDKSSNKVDETYLHLAKETCDHLGKQKPNRILNIESHSLPPNSLRTQTQVDETYLHLAKETCDHLDKQKLNRILNIESHSLLPNSLRTQTQNTSNE
ncbi:unnamed protein product [Schistosoma rodhaini]|uniref:Ras-associating domain-containing protein n=1 Tax=Schistosoma mansoni TaxID=6183 RepID=A0A3Q0KLT4_SCHMA|nr:unnamed protein product [Schistosoma rodhaini]